MTAARNALTATPVSNNAAIESRPPAEATAYTSARAPAAPANAIAGRASGNAALAPIAIARTAPAAPPVDTPMMPGSAIGFRNSPCMIAPDTPSAPPTSNANTIRGRRIVSTIARSVAVAALSARPARSRMTPTACNGGIA